MGYLVDGLGAPALERLNRPWTGVWAADYDVQEGGLGISLGDLFLESKDIYRKDGFRRGRERERGPCPREIQKDKNIDIN